MESAVFENRYFYIQVHDSSIPWLKIFTKKHYKELSDCDEHTQKAVLEAMLTIEKKMLEYYQPTKVNIAMFGNYLPHFHIHVMARFKEDSHFPEPMWGLRQREGKLSLPSFENFLHVLTSSLKV